MADAVRTHLVAIVILTLLVAACGNDDPDSTTGLEGLIEQEQEDDEETALVFDGPESINLAGVAVNPSTIESGECFNEYLYRDQSDFVQQVTTIVSCDGPHDREAYFVREYPAADVDSYPLDDELQRWAESMCLDEFEAFVGLEYVLSVLEIGAVVPTFEGWTDEGDRNVICYVFPDQGGRLLASVANSQI